MYKNPSDQIVYCGVCRYSFSQNLKKKINFYFFSVFTNGKKFETQVNKKKTVEAAPALAYFPGMNNSKILFVESDISSGNFGPKDFLKIPQNHLNSNEFHGVDFTFLHTPIEWTPKELFKTVQSIKTMNKNVGLGR